MGELEIRTKKQCMIADSHLILFFSLRSICERKRLRT